MADFILMTGDTVQFMPAMGPAIVAVIPGTYAGKARAFINKIPACVQGDELQVIVPGCMYTSGAFTIPGVGNLTIIGISTGLTAVRVKSGGKPVLIKGSTFQAKFDILTPAQMPPPVSTPDAPGPRSGTCSFITKNTRVKAT